MEISIIVPVYNVDKYINRCLDSIVNQTFKEFEVILVDDGSTDESGKICDEYAKIDKRVRVIHKENGGLSEARNVGILNARGRFVTYIDSDDFVSEDYLLTLYSIQKKHNCDIVSASFKIFYGNYDELISNKESKELDFYTGYEACRELLRGRLPSSSCNMLIRKTIAKQHPFPIRKYHEDEFTTFRYYLSAKKVCKVDRILYYYYQREGSIVHQFGVQVLDELESAENYCVVCSKISSNLLRDAKYRKYIMFKQIINDYPELKEIYPERYNNVVDYIKLYSNVAIFKLREPFRYKINTMIKFIMRKIKNGVGMK